MKRSLGHLATAWALSFFGPAAAIFACGPFFPETILNQPRATLRPPLVSFESEVRQIQPPSAPPPCAKPRAEFSSGSFMGGGDIKAVIVDPEVVEMGEILGGQPEARRQELCESYRGLRTAMLQKYPADFYDTDGLTVPAEGYRLFAEAELGRWPDWLPEDVKLYLQGALQYDYGDQAQAIDTWKRLLDLPLEKRKNRSVAAAWMIARILRKTEGPTAAQPWYEKCETMSAEGLRDSLGLGLASIGWQARYALEQHDTRRAMELYYHQAMAGDPSAWSSLAHTIPDPESASEEELARWVSDPFLRGLMTAALLRSTSNWDSKPDGSANARWLAALEHANILEAVEAGRFAELAYSSGDYSVSRRWLQRAPANDPRALWVRGKIALMDGDTKAAENFFTRAQPGFPRKIGEENKSILLRDRPSPQQAADFRVSQFFGDLGAANLARNHYFPALTALYRGSFFEDAAYVAERVFSTEELLQYTRQHFPKAGRKENKSSYLPYYDQEDVSTFARWLLARRLARERYFKDALPYFPAEFQPVFARYVSLDRESRSRGSSRAERSAALWEAAQIHRALGLEFFGTVGQPDSAMSFGQFPATNFIGQRLGLKFANIPLGDQDGTEGRADVVPKPDSDEIYRVRKNRLPNEKRFQYRYAAADLAWKAAGLMPDNSEETARVLGIAGTWLQNRDPKAADRFYKAMIWRNWSTPLAREADAKRWFPPLVWEYDPFAAAGVSRPDRY